EDVLNGEGGAGRRVFFVGVMSFGDAEFVVWGGRGEFARDAEHGLDADGKIGSVEKADVLSLREGAHVFKVRVPAGGSHDDAGSIREAGAQVVEDGFRRGEVDDGVETGEEWGGERGGVGVFLFAEHADAMTVFVRHVGNQAAGFASS